MRCQNDLRPFKRTYPTTHAGFSVVSGFFILPLKIRSYIFCVAPSKSKFFHFFVRFTMQITVLRKRPENTLAMGCSDPNQRLAVHFATLLLCQKFSTRGKKQEKIKVSVSLTTQKTRKIWRAQNVFTPNLPENFLWKFCFEFPVTTHRCFLCWVTKNIKQKYCTEGRSSQQKQEARHERYKRNWQAQISALKYELTYLLMLHGLRTLPISWLQLHQSLSWFFFAQ